MHAEPLKNATAQAFHRLEDDPLLRGKGRFLADITMPGMLHVAFVRSSHAHALIHGIQRERACALPGVTAVLTLDDLRPLLRSERIALALPSAYLRFHVDPLVLVDNEATYVGEPIALVVAESRSLAEDAAGLVEIDYEPLPVVTDVIASVESGAARTRLDCPDNLVARTTVAYGDADEAFRSAAHVLSERFRIHKGGGHSLEGRGVIASYEELTGLLTMWNSTQMPHRCKSIIVDMMGLTERNVRVIAPDVGGGFGPKAVFHPEELAMAAAAVLVKKPLKWVEDRLENFLATVLERDQVWTAEAAFAADGRLLGVRGEVWHDHGACTPYGLAIPYNSVNNLVGNYKLPSMHFDINWCMTNKVPTSSTRGAGRPQGTFVIERFLDLAAKTLGIDRLEIRRRNLIAAAEMPFSTPIRMRDGSMMTYDSGDYPECQRRAAELADLEGFASRRADSASRGLLRGIGFSNYVELTGRGPFESVSVRIGPSGQVFVASGASSQGQGTKTMLAKLVADELRISPESIDVTCGDSDASLLGVGAFASRQTVNAGNSAVKAAQAVAKKAIKIASTLMEADEDDLELYEGTVRVKGVPDLSRGFGELSRVVNGSIGFPMPGGIEPGLFATSNHQVEGTPFANGAHVAEVEVDPKTGYIKILKFVVVHDCGRLINPKIVDGQVYGAVVHGIGNALLEHMKYDENGQPLTATYADYLLPTCDTVPVQFILEHLESPSPLNPLGVKGAGEGGTIGAPAAIASAVEDALHEYGVVIRELPITPQSIHSALVGTTEVLC